MTDPEASATKQEGEDSYGDLFRRFLGFGFRAWGGPAAQIAMIRDDVVDEARWLSQERFNRLLAVYQILPGPEATEMCVHLGYMRRGRMGAILAGLGFMLPGFILMLALAWLYVNLGSQSPWLLALLVGFPPAVAALIVTACARLGKHALHDSGLGLACLGVAAATLFGLPFYVALPVAGVGYVLARNGLGKVALVVGILVPMAWLAYGPPPPEVGAGSGDGASTASLGWSGLKAGLLTFGGAYTSIPFLQQDSVGDYVSLQQFLDGLALSGILPAPLIIFATFLGFLGGSWHGALAMTAGIFLPAFAFTLFGYRHLESISSHPRLAQFLDGVTAGVIGLLAATALGITLAATLSPLGKALFLAALLVLVAWQSKWATPAVILACGGLGAAASLP